MTDVAAPQQMTLFKDQTPASKRRKRPKLAPADKAALPPVAPPDLTQESALWLLGQRSIAEQRGRRYVRRSVKHPGKMQPDGAGAIINTYTEPGQIILDPMLGIGTTAVEAAERGRHVVGVELEARWAKVAWCNALRTAYRGAPGTIRVIQGDSRRLPELVAGAFDHLVTSPPFGPTQTGRGIALEGINGDERPPVERGVGAPYDAVVTSPPYGPAEGGGGRGLKPPEMTESEWAAYEQGKGPSPGWRGYQTRAYTGENHSPNQADALISSPPYGPAAQDDLPERTTDEAVDEKGLGYRWKGYGQRHYAEQNHSPEQADAMVSSPPYGDNNLEERDLHNMQVVAGRIDAMVTSPAYGDIRQDGGNHQFGESGAMGNYSGEARVKKTRDRTNVGNLKYGSMEKALGYVARLKAGETVTEADWPGMEYLETMALIYWHCLHLVKPGGLAVLVLKDYRRDKQRVDLVGDTIQLMKAVGWLYHDQALAVTSKVEDGRVITKVSPFVRINARKPEKHGGVLMLPAGEVVLVFRKEG